MRTFPGGADRDDDADKIDPEGALSPHVLTAFCEYMHRHRVRADGTIRSAGNWKRGMGKSVFMKSLWRHFLDLWTAHTNGYFDEEAACGVFFNLQGYMHESLEPRRTKDAEVSIRPDPRIPCDKHGRVITKGAEPGPSL